MILRYSLYEPPPASLLSFSSSLLFHHRCHFIIIIISSSSSLYHHHQHCHYLHHHFDFITCIALWPTLSRPLTRGFYWDKCYCARTRGGFTEKLMNLKPQDSWLTKTPYKNIHLILCLCFQFFFLKSITP